MGHQQYSSVPKKGGMTVVLNDNNELIPSRTVTGWRVCIDYRKLNDATRKDHFPLPFIDQMLERLCGNEYYCFLDGFSGFFQILIAPEDQEKTTFHCPLGLLLTDEYRMLARCEETNLVLNWEKCHFMVKEGIVLGHKISGACIEVDRAKINVIAKLPYLINVKGFRSFLGHAGFYRRFIKDFSMISKPMTQLLMKDAKFNFSDDCKKAFNILKEKLTTTPIIISPDWNTPFELIRDASDFTVGDVLEQRIDVKFKLIYYASKTLNNAQEHYTTTEKELLAVDAKPRLIRLENPDLGTFTEEEIADEFPDEHLMILKVELNDDEPWYADYVNYIVGKIMPPKWTPEKRRSKILDILAHCHSGPTGGHHSASITGRKVYESGFFWPSIFKDAKDYVMRCDACQRSGNISSKSEMPQNNIQLSNVFWKDRLDITRRIGLKSLTMHCGHSEPPTKHLLDVPPLAAAKNRFMELNELMELRDGAYKNTRIYKERTKKWHDSRLRGDKNFKVGDKVWLFNSRFKVHPDTRDRILHVFPIFCTRPRCKKIDDVGEISTIWKSRSVGVLKSQDGCSTHMLAHELNLEN
ncbi:reverse transcriptase domain-containing protein [Tanacetum coccineum]